MKYNFRFNIILILLLSATFLSADPVKFKEEPLEFPLFNRNNSKIYQYYLVEPGEKLIFSCLGADSLIIISRVLIEDVKNVQYEYALHRSNDVKRVPKEAAKSSVTRGMGGEAVSTYNKISLNVKDNNENFELSNISSARILFKLNADIANESSEKIEYIRFTPSYYETEKILKVRDKSYTYYSSVNQPMQFKLEGPVVLKIISRLIFDSNFVNRKKYRYEVLDNGKSIAVFTEEAYKSDTAILVHDKEKIPSTGDVNIITLEEGIHNIEIKDGVVNRDIIFRIYISKSSVEIKD